MQRASACNVWLTSLITEYPAFVGSLTALQSVAESQCKALGLRGPAGYQRTRTSKYYAQARPPEARLGRELRMAGSATVAFQKPRGPPIWCLPKSKACDIHNAELRSELRPEEGLNESLPATTWSVSLGRLPLSVGSHPPCAPRLANVSTMLSKDRLFLCPHQPKTVSPPA